MHLYNCTFDLLASLGQFNAMLRKLLSRDLPDDDRDLQSLEDCQICQGSAQGLRANFINFLVPAGQLGIAKMVHAFVFSLRAQNGGSNVSRNCKDALGLATFVQKLPKLKEEWHSFLKIGSLRLKQRWVQQGRGNSQKHLPQPFVAGRPGQHWDAKTLEEDESEGASSADLVCTLPCVW